MQPLTGPYVYGVNRRSENFLLLSDLLLREEGVPEADINVYSHTIVNFKVCFRQEIPLFHIFCGYATRHSDA